MSAAKPIALDVHSIQKGITDSDVWKAGKNKLFAEAFETVLMIDGNFGDNAPCDLMMVNFKKCSESHPVF